jgi:hypothetical protein
MVLPVGSWLRAISVRGSTRSFAREALDRESLDRLERICREFRPFPEARAVLVRERMGKVASGVIGAYGRVSGAPCYLAFIGRMDSSRVQECVGYTGEGLILEATAMGLGTCWVGGFFRPDAVSPSAGLGRDERVIAVSPVGKVRSVPSLTDVTFKAISGSSRRDPLKALVEEGLGFQGRWNAALEAARIAPSARNRQPWRFRLEEDAVTVLADIVKANEKLSRRLDCGIAMLHFELGARTAGIDGAWQFLEAPEVARFQASVISSS